MRNRKVRGEMKQNGGSLKYKIDTREQGSRAGEQKRRKGGREGVKESEREREREGLKDHGQISSLRAKWEASLQNLQPATH